MTTPFLENLLMPRGTTHDKGIQKQPGTVETEIFRPIIKCLCYQLLNEETMGNFHIQHNWKVSFHSGLPSRRQKLCALILW